MSTERDDMARVLFIADNASAKDPAAEWEHAGYSQKLYVRKMADALIAAGYTKGDAAWGACGTHGCIDCLPLFDADNSPICGTSQQ
jgi:hypothetical protein